MKRGTIKILIRDDASLEKQVCKRLLHFQTTTYITTFDFGLTCLFFWGSLQVRLGPKVSSKNLWGWCKNI